MAFCSLLRTGFSDETEFMQQVYAICHDADKKTMRSNQKRLFSILYQLILQQPEGPRVPVLVQALGKERVLALLEF
ncbi:lysyl-tRNA synthetase [compost metagenome]